VLNAAGPGLFASIQQLMFDDAILRICRLTDPAGNRHQENLSLERMLDATSWKTTDSAKWKTYRTKLDQVEDICGPCRIHRNKRVSHKNIASLQNLPVATMKMIDDASASIQGFVGAIHSELNQGSAYSFNLLIDGDRDAKHLMRYLRNRASQSRPEAVSNLLYTPG
jgi:hypothetical protein